jgi:hypothetical protein
MNYFQCKISYLSQNDDGSISKKNEEYVLNALSFIEAETKLQEYLEELIPEYNLLSCKKTNLSDVVIDESKDNFFKTKVSYVSFDEDSGKQKKINEVFLVQADSLKETLSKMEARLVGSIVDWEIPNITKTNIVEFFQYSEN